MPNWLRALGTLLRGEHTRRDELQHGRVEPPARRLRLSARHGHPLLERDPPHRAALLAWWCRAYFVAGQLAQEPRPFARDPRPPTTVPRDPWRGDFHVDLWWAVKGL